MIDIADRMRDSPPCLEPCRIRNTESGCMCAEAADEIERLRTLVAEIHRLREVLTKIARLGVDLSADYSRSAMQANLARDAIRQV